MRAGPLAPCDEVPIRGRPVAVTPHAEKWRHHGQTSGDNGGAVVLPPPYPLRAVKVRLLSVRRKMLQVFESESLIRGERPTRAVPLSVRKSLFALRLVTGRGERTRIGPRGVVTKWSDKDELFRLSAGGDQ